MKKDKKSNPSPSPLHFPGTSQPWRKREKGGGVFRGGSASTIPGSRETEQAVTWGTVLTRDLNCNQGATDCAMKTCADHSYLEKYMPLKRQDRQKARKEKRWKVTDAQGELPFRGERSLLSVCKGRALSTT